MIDAEYAIYNKLEAKLAATHTGITVTSVYTPVMESFPAVSIEEKDNKSYVNSLDASATENHARLMYEINVYSNKEFGKKAEAKSIMATIDGEMLALKFVRTSCIPTPNPMEPSIYRMTARYECVISSDYRIYRR